MDTTLLKDLITEHATRLRGRLWPNGMGFDKGGWEYTYSETGKQWGALYRGKVIRRDKYGVGDSPENARANATTWEGA